MEKIKLRELLEFEQIEKDGDRFLVIKDPFEIITEPLFIPSFLGPLLVMMDGESSLELLLFKAEEQGLPREITRAVVEEFEKLSLLESPSFQQKLDSLTSGYRAEDKRKAEFAGSIYSADAEGLKAEIGGYLEQSANGESIGVKTPRVFLSPHIDYQRGHQTYSALFNFMKAGRAPDTLFLLGTCHKPSRNRFVLSEKIFESPLGDFRIAEHAVDLLKGECGQLLDEEILHKNEHSLELQLPFLGAIGFFPKIVPIIVGSFYDFTETGISPRKSEEIAKFVDALANAARAEEQAGRSYAFFAGVDFAHVGRFFDDPGKLSASDLEAIKARDFELIEALRSNDPELLFSHIASDKDRRRICGFPTLYTILAVMERLDISPKLQLLEYRQAFDEFADCLVSFAAGVWTDD